MYLPEPGASHEKRTFLPGNERGSDLFYLRSAMWRGSGEHQLTYMSNRRATPVAGNVEVLA